MLKHLKTFRFVLGVRTIVPFFCERNHHHRRNLPDIYKKVVWHSSQTTLISYDVSEVILTTQALVESSAGPILLPHQFSAQRMTLMIMLVGDAGPSPPLIPIADTACGAYRRRCESPHQQRVP